MTSTLKQNKSKTILLFICTLLTANALTGMEKQTPERSVIIHNFLSTPALAIICYNTLTNERTQEKKLELQSGQVSEKIILPSDTTINFMIKTINCIHENTIKPYKNEIIIRKLDIAPLITITHLHTNGFETFFYKKNGDLHYQHPVYARLSENNSKL